MLANINLSFERKVRVAIKPTHLTVIIIICYYRFKSCYRGFEKSVYTVSFLPCMDQGWKSLFVTEKSGLKENRKDYVTWLLNNYSSM